MPYFDYIGFTGQRHMKQSFRLVQATFEFGDTGPTVVDFVAHADRKPNDIHFTLLMGANGTGKSRILASCVNLLRQEARNLGVEGTSTVLHHRGSDLFERDLNCLSAKVIRNGKTVELPNGRPFKVSSHMPSRVLALANLVRDRFVFVDWENEKNQFYYYLGVRQASNLTTTGAMDRLVSDASLHILTDEAKYDTFRSWVHALFGSWRLRLSFDRFSPKRISDFLQNPRLWIEQSVGDARVSTTSKTRKRAIENIPLIIEFLNYLTDLTAQEPSLKGTRTIVLDDLSQVKRRRLGEYREAMALSSYIRVMSRPTLMFGQHDWLEFRQLSSGEQNLLATGARLIAFATPASCILIDEPEVSLNVAWQQRYIELITRSLKHAPGSHVLIASHSPYLIADLRADNATVVVAARQEGQPSFKTRSGDFWGWGSEAILYKVLGLPSASNYEFSREMAAVLRLVTEHSTDAALIAAFLHKCEQLELTRDQQALKTVIDDIRKYFDSLTQ